MIDELADISNHEQVVLVFRWVGEDFEVHEDFFGVYKVQNILADTLVNVIVEVLCRMNLSIHKCRGQCYDGASNMRWEKSGVATKLLYMEPIARYGAESIVHPLLWTFT